MFRIIPPALHGVLDYVFAAILVIAPTLLGASAGSTAVAFVVGVALAALSLVTDYPLGAVALVPAWAHGVVEAGLAALLLFLGLLAAPARGLYAVVGIALALVAGLTDYQATERDPTLRHPVRVRASPRRRS